jgi:hypothetical protein
LIQINECCNFAASLKAKAQAFAKSRGVALRFERVEARLDPSSTIPQ